MPQLETLPKKVLIIGIVWPEPQSSAAGVRSLTLTRVFLEAGYEVHFASTAKDEGEVAKLAQQSIIAHCVRPNDPEFDSWIQELNPDQVIFERFMIEEQFGWRVAKACPQSVRILDTTDLHFVRRARQKALTADGRVEWLGEDAYREVASIYRSDLTLVISEFEFQLLTDPLGDFRVPRECLEVFSFCYDSPMACRPDAERAGFVFMGNFRHEPNADAVRWLKSAIWPLIRKELSTAQVHIYGAYPSREFMNLHAPERGIHVLGPAVNQYETFSKYRLNLAPLRFGAGLKGKIADGWWCGTPCVSTRLGAEGMTSGESFGGEIQDSPENFANAAVKIFQNQSLIEEHRKTGYEIILEKFAHSTNAPRLLGSLNEVTIVLTERRRRNFTGAMLNHHLCQSTKYLSRWIELKNTVLPQKR